MSAIGAKTQLKYKSTACNTF